MVVSSNEDVNQEIENPKKISSSSDALQVIDKVIWFSHHFDNEGLFESMVKVIEGM